MSKKFKDTVALDDVSFTVDEGEIFGFLGPSGAGKTTTINILTNQLKEDNGTVEILGKKPEEITSDDYLKMGIMSDTVGFYENMTVYKNLEFFARFHGIPMAKVDELLKRLDLYEDRNKKAKKISTGMRQRLLLIRAILHEPEIVFLDEPTSGMDPTLSQKVHQLLLELKAKGISIFLTTHNMQEATKLCDKISLLNKGKILEYGSPEEIISKYRVDDNVHLLYKNGEEKVVPRDEVAGYLNSNVVSMHTAEPDLETIFIKLTGEKWHGE
ncbi:bacitracin ABC transporter ATP-binding protein [Streptococcus equinus JB1]|uniref:ABC-2 type transport system ATP-binding protein n=1 Tax=Streptococcus equinus JB1 TaxID=1294274 RepID=A0A091BST5_STREI|nr:ABC transporter ATP-binding protein [Streptococcus equinus]KFN87500.1 bacitracin ABC transporter ATP-binding protein [Streptococcus equinus JB1]SFL12289.1 ABC-2 type transport system ATP-binding protein [Streptococcus equinus JB1]